MRSSLDYYTFILLTIHITFMLNIFKCWKNVRFWLLRKAFGWPFCGSGWPERGIESFLPNYVIKASWGQNHSIPKTWLSSLLSDASCVEATFSSLKSPIEAVSLWCSKVYDWNGWWHSAAHCVFVHCNLCHVVTSHEGTRWRVYWPRLCSQKWFKQFSLWESHLEFSNSTEPSYHMWHTSQLPSDLQKCTDSQELAVRKIWCMKRSLFHTAPYYYVITTQA